MSYTTMYAFNAEGDGVVFGEFHNAFRSAFRVWKALVEKFFPDLLFFDEKAFAKAWRLFDDPAQPIWLRLTLGATFDKVYVSRADFRALAEAFEQFEAEFPFDADSTGGPASSLLAQARALKDAAGNSDIVAIGWRQTSVSENLFWVNAVCNCCGQDLEEGGGIRLTVEGAWDLFEQIREMDRPK